MEIVADDRSMDLAKVIRGETRLNDNVIITSDVQRNVGGGGACLRISSRATAKLTSANFLIPVSPQRPQIEYADRLILPGSNVTARAGEIAALTCRARYGNPSPLIKWFVIVAP